MKKRLAFLFALLAFFTTHIQAQQPEKAAIAEAYKTLKGNWEWTESSFASRGVKPSPKTPSNTKQTVTVTFNADTTASLFVNKEAAGTFKYTVTKPMNEYLMIRFETSKGNSEFLPEGPLTFESNGLVIAGGFNDAGSNVKYKKLAAPTKNAASKKTATKKTSK